MIYDTDLPIVVSQKHVALIDPHRKCIKAKSETSPAGTKKKLTSFLKHRGHASTFESVFNLSTKEKRYDGTIFRFPLRQQGSDSEISNKVYTPEMIQTMLFESLKEESPYVLLFLRNVKSISLMEWTEDSPQPCETFRVDVLDQTANDISEDDNAQVQSRTELFAKQCSQNSEMDNSEIYVELRSMTVTVNRYNDTSAELTLDNHHWLVLKVVGTNDVELDNLGRELSILPWVGLATRLPRQVALCECEATTTKLLSDCSTLEIVFKQLESSLERARLSVPWSNEASNSTTGHAFCFLPLPECTAMPVHVHGYFAVTDNRRSIKWPAHDEKGKEAGWNKELLYKMVAPSYALLLACRTCLIHYEETPLPIANTDCVTDAYSTWPLYPEVKNVQIWNELVSPTLKMSFSLPMLWTSAGGGKWVQFSEAYYLSGSVSTSSYSCNTVVIQMLIKLNIPMVSLPRDICETIKQNEYLVETVKNREISPQFVREMICRNPGSCSRLSREEVYDMLDFVLSDLNGTTYHYLVGIPLLPLKGASEMVVFQRPTSSNCKYVFSSKSKPLLEVVPGADSLIVDPELPEKTAGTFCDIANTGCLQLKEVNTEAMGKRLLPESIHSW